MQNPTSLLMRYTNEFLKESSTVLGTCMHQKTTLAFLHLQAGVAGQVQEISPVEKMNSQYIRHEVRGCETSDLRNFWEKTIEEQTRYLQIEKERQRRSALTKLRNEWMERLEKRIKMLRTQPEDPSS
ncbi:hypothetical protein Q9233_005027 [Columba guinea]|nr:hypothetical protein Q9233_005027 [Columba guinea]